MVLVLTGNACGGGCFASVLPQPEFDKTTRPRTAGRIAEKLFKILTPSEKSDELQMPLGDGEVQDLISIGVEMLAIIVKT